MSYICDRCSAVRYGSELKREDEVREVTYTRNTLRFDRNTKIKIPIMDTNFYGKEVVSYEKLCEKCYDEFKDVPPRISTKPKTVQFVGTKKKFVKSTETSQDDENLDFKGLKDKLEGRR